MAVGSGGVRTVAGGSVNGGWSGDGGSGDGTRPTSGRSRASLTVALIIEST